jgi:hypothetical protein
MVVAFPNRRQSGERVYFCEQKRLTVNGSVCVASATVRLCYYRYKILPYVKSLNNLSNTLRVSRSATTSKAIITPRQPCSKENITKYVHQIFQSKFYHILEGPPRQTYLLPPLLTLQNRGESDEWEYGRGSFPSCLRGRQSKIIWNHLCASGF